MQYRKPYYYSEFSCIADKCPATCCDGWAIVIDEKTMQRYKNLPENDREYVLSHVDEQAGCFVQCGSRCSFLNDNLLCDLYTRMGEDGFCNTCRRYPRHFEEYGNLMEAALSLSCPVAAKMIVDNKNYDKFVSYVNDKKAPHDGEVDTILLGALLLTREHIFEIMNDRNLSLQIRMRRAFLFSSKVQKLIYNYERLGKKVRLKHCVAEFLLKMDMLVNQEKLHADSMYEQWKESSRNLPIIDIKSRQIMDKYTSIILGLENINDKWPVLINEMKQDLYVEMDDGEYKIKRQAFDEYMKDRMYEYEHIFNYFIYTYFLGGVYDYNIQSMFKMAGIAVAIIRDLGMHKWIKNGGHFSVEEQIEICYTYSRQIEHSDDNLTSLEGLLNAHPEFCDEMFKTII